MANILTTLSRATTTKAMSMIPQGGRGPWRLICEPFTGAWQRNQEEKRGTLLCYPTLYACLNRIASDVGKLPFVLKRLDFTDTWVTEVSSEYSPVLRKPNHYQTAQQFRESWMLSKLQHGNTYVLKRRNENGAVTALYVLDPCRTMPLISDSGDVFYQISTDTAQSLLGEDYNSKTVVVPAREIIHDRMNTFHHPLVGVPPLCAAYWPAVKNLRALQSAAAFFGNGARPGGILTVPQGITDEKAAELKEFWNTNFQGENSGKVAVIGADVRYESIVQSSVDSQLVEQMKFSDEQICQAFGVPPFMIGLGQIPAGMRPDEMAVHYFTFALQSHIEAMEGLLDEGLGIAPPRGVELDLEPLLRMDEMRRAEVATKLVGGKIATPNEARRRFDLKPATGGDRLFGQAQDFPLDVLAERTDRPGGEGAIA